MLKFRTGGKSAIGGPFSLCWARRTGLIEAKKAASLGCRGDVLNNTISLNNQSSTAEELSMQRLPMLTVEALPAACKPLKAKSTAKLGEKLRAILAMI